VFVEPAHSNIVAHAFPGLPPGSRVIDSITFGTAAWTRALRITVVLENGQEQSYFLKVSSYHEPHYIQFKDQVRYWRQRQAHG
jgi:hypothetical protein